MSDFNFEEWFKSLSISKDIHDNYENAILDLATNDINISSYTTSHNLIDNIGFIRLDQNHKFYLDIQIPKIGDITTNFIAYPYYSLENSSSEINLKLIANGQILPISNDLKLINAFGPHTELKIRLIFNDEPFSVIFKYVSYVLQPKLKDDLIEKNFIQDNIRYIVTDF